MSAQKRTKAKRASHRYSVGEKAKILKIADRVGIAKAVARTGASSWSIYRWRKARDLAAKQTNTSAQSTPEEVIKPVRIQVPAGVQKKVVGVWRHNPGFGPSQVSRQLRRIGIRCDTKTVRKILLAHGYTPPKARGPRPRETRRFEASRPLELVQMDVLQFYVHAQRVYLLLALDDHSRFIIGWDLLQRESMEAAMDVIEGAIGRYGKPEAVLTDRGAVFHTWSGIGKFDRLLESYDIEHVLASPHHPQTCGKVEAVNKAIQKELIRRVEFRNFLDAKEQVARWVDEFNHQRTHQGIGGVLVPADRFYGRADRVLARIESAAHGGGRGPVPPELETADEDREISLFQIRLARDTIELWLFGRCVVRLPIEDDVS